MNPGMHSALTLLDSNIVLKTDSLLKATTDATEYIATIHFPEDTDRPTFHLPSA